MADFLSMSKCLTRALAFTTGLLLQAPVSEAAIPPRPVLVELFTSEGCSSCPPADRLLAELDRNQPLPGSNIIVLSEHVDYWDHLGWKDPHSSHKWTERQSDYARRFGLDDIYTPQMVVDGVRQVNGSDAYAVRHAIEESGTSPALAITVSTIERSGDKLRVTVTIPDSASASLYAVIADASDRSTVDRGENQGRTLEHIAVARSLDVVAQLQAPFTSKVFDVALPPGDHGRHFRLILFAQDQKSGRVLGVAERPF